VIVEPNVQGRCKIADGCSDGPVRRARALLTSKSVKGGDAVGATSLAVYLSKADTDQSCARHVVEKVCNLED